jgi:uridine kinase
MILNQNRKTAIIIWTARIVWGGWKAVSRGTRKYISHSFNKADIIMIWFENNEIAIDLELQKTKNELHTASLYKPHYKCG